MFNKKAFDELAELYGEHLIKINPPLPYWYTAQQEFQKKWTLSAFDISSMIDQSIDESSGKWSLPLNEAKSVQLIFSKVNSDLLIATWKDLVNEQKSLDGRIDRFLFHMDLLLSETNADRIIIPDHHHNKYIISIYLCFHSPSLYFPFDYQLFSDAMIKMRALNIPEEYEIERYYKIGRIITKYLIMNERILEYYANNNIIHYPINQLIAYDFLRFVNRNH